MEVEEGEGEDNLIQENSINSIPDNIINLLGEIKFHINNFINENITDHNLLSKKLFLILKKIIQIIQRDSSLFDNDEIINFDSLNFQNNLLDNSNKSQKVKITNTNKNPFFQTQIKMNFKHFNRNHNQRSFIGLGFGDDYFINKNNSTYDFIKERRNSKEIEKSNKYYVSKLIRRLKKEHETYQLRELAYLEKISAIQGELNYYEKEKETQNINNSNSINKSDINNNTITKFPDIKNNSAYNTISNSIIENGSVNRSVGGSIYASGKMKKNLSDFNDDICKKLYIYNFNKNRNNRSNVSHEYSYRNFDFAPIDSNFKILDFQKHKNHNSFQKLHYKYGIGNTFLKHDFKQIKNTILKNGRTIRALKEGFNSPFTFKINKNGKNLLINKL